MSDARTSAAILIAGNLIPLAGAFLLGWNAADLVTLYWIENIIIGLLNIPRMLLAAPESAELIKGEVGGGEAQSLSTRVAANAQPTIFFVIHYGFFCAVHAVVLVEFFAPPGIEDKWLALRALLGAMIGDKFVVAGVVALCVSHVCSFLLNYLGRREYQRIDAGALMGRPYRRVFVVQVFAIAAGALLTHIEGGIALVVLFVLVKIAIDWQMHQREHDELTA